MNLRPVFKLCKQTANSSSISFLSDHIGKFNSLLQTRYNDKIKSMQLDTRLSISTGILCVLSISSLFEGQQSKKLFEY